MDRLHFAWCLVFFFLAQVSSASSDVFDPIAVPDMCKNAKYEKLCLELVAQNHTKDALVRQAMLHAKDGLQELRHSCKNMSSSSDHGEGKMHAALNDCSGLLEDASELVHDCLSEGYYFSTTAKLEDIQTWMSAALTDWDTCIDGLKDAGSSGKSAARRLEKQGAEVNTMISTALSLVASMYPPGTHPSRSWLRGRILATASTPVPNVTVAKDGSGQFSSISAAIAAAPTQSRTRYVIYVKQGTYVESFEVPKSKPNLMLLGDGIRKTIITGSKSVQDPGVTTFTSATVIVSGNNFLGQGITIQNTAGAVNHQAVALRVTADKVAFYKCSFEGFQDTLYAHSLRQFYSQCRIYGTVDFIFGNAAAVFLNSELVARVPMTNQKNTFTAQGRTDPSQNTGFSFQGCTVDGNADLKSAIQSFPTYLGRPWKEYSLTVFLKCYQGNVINPAGWLEWDGDFALKTLFYGEYQNQGPGSGTSRRVSWSTQITSQDQANRFSARNFVAGQEWLPQTSFPFQLDV
ncbi:pectinesterase [Selaginella moellendorffii]|nr:pectinesterase [Selaginella moellendorffii]|eukprot:XP_002970369.2 pectinesterase [Selaginella moellendorffii]